MGVEVIATVETADGGRGTRRRKGTGRMREECGITGEGTPGQRSLNIKSPSTTLLLYIQRGGGWIGGHRSPTRKADYSLVTVIMSRKLHLNAMAPRIEAQALEDRLAATEVSATDSPTLYIRKGQRSMPCVLFAVAVDVPQKRS